MKIIRDVFLVLLFLAVTAPDSARALSQWTRKYKTPCSTCHTGFPRLNYYGERFMWNGYQDPDGAELDGDKLGKTSINDDLSIDKVENWLGARLNLDAVRYRTDRLKIDGELEDDLEVAGPKSRYSPCSAALLHRGGA